MTSEMGTTPRRTVRASIHLSGNHALADELGSFGEVVVGREVQIPSSERKGQREDFCLRRLIVAWRRLGRLDLPWTIFASGAGSPDFLIEKHATPMRLAIEHTNAGSEEYQRWLTKTARSDDEFAFVMYSSNGYVGSDVPKQEASEIHTAIDRKSDKNYDWPDVQQRHLLVYLNSDAVRLPGDVERIVERVRQRHTMAERSPIPFDEIHLIIGEMVIVDVVGKAAQVDVSDAYEIDLARWTRAQSQALRSGELDRLDLSNIAEELESMGRRDRRALRSQLRRLLVHLLKWRTQPAQRSGSWRSSIREARTSIDDILTESPSLRSLLEQFVSEEFPRARIAAADETEIPSDNFPEQCPFAIEEIVDLNFLPETRA